VIDVGGGNAIDLRCGWVVVGAGAVWIPAAGTSGSERGQQVSGAKDVGTPD
jgi:hypothetical protein